MWGTFLSEPLDIAALVGRYPANKLMSRMPILYRLTALPDSPCEVTGLWGINPDFSGLSPCKGQVAYALLTRAPVSERIATLLPLDLHVLSLPLAFILSQDQTLRCIENFKTKLFIPSSRPGLIANLSSQNPKTELQKSSSSYLLNIFNELVFPFLFFRPLPGDHPSGKKRGKSNTYFISLQNFLNLFLEAIFYSLSTRLLTKTSIRTCPRPDQYCCHQFRDCKVNTFYRIYD